MPFEFSGSLPLNPTPKSVITAMAGFEVAFAFPFVERFSGSGLGLKLRAPANPGMAGFAASEPVITSMAGFSGLFVGRLWGVHGGDALVAAGTELINATRGLEKSMGTRLPKCSSPSFAQRVKEAVPAEIRDALLPLVGLTAALSDCIQGY